MISTGLIGIESRLSIVPRSVSRVTESAVKISVVIVRIVPSSPGTMLSAVTAAGLWRGGGGGGAGGGADFEGGARRIWDCVVVDQRGLDQRAQRRERRARGDWIGGIRCDQQRGLVAAPKRAFEAARDLDCEQHLARRKYAV